MMGKQLYRQQHFNGFPCGWKKVTPTDKWKIIHTIHSQCDLYIEIKICWIFKMWVHENELNVFPTRIEYINRC